MLGRRRQNSVGRQLQVQVLLLQDPVHQGDDLQEEINHSSKGIHQLLMKLLVPDISQLDS